MRMCVCVCECTSKCSVYVTKWFDEGVGKESIEF